VRTERQEELRDAVVDAAFDFIREVENPAPDLLYRHNLRVRLADAVQALREDMK
jgi:hypothetical protein